MDKFDKTMQDAAAKINLTLTSLQVEQFYNYYKSLLEWNNNINLTAITAMDQVIEKHFIDSLLAVSIIDEEKHLTSSAKLIDVGTGAGFPGIPLKVYYPDLNITLLDSLAKRLNFLESIIEQLQLTNIWCIHGRAEDYGKENNYRHQFNIATSRAVAHLPILLEYCLPFLKVDGILLAYKGSEVDNEMKEAEKALTILGGKIVECKKTQLPLSGDFRSLVVIKKTKETPDKYPRKAGLPSKKPFKSC